MNVRCNMDKITIMLNEQTGVMVQLNEEGERGRGRSVERRGERRG